LDDPRYRAAASRYRLAPIRTRCDRARRTATRWLPIYSPAKRAVRQHAAGV